MALSFVINEYVHIHVVTPNLHFSYTEWIVVYEPIELMPIVEGSLRGTIYNGGEQRQFVVAATGKVLELGLLKTIGYLDELTGIINIFCNEKPHEENYLCVSYKHSNDPPEKSNWLQEGF